MWADPAPHINAGFREHFADWFDFANYVAEEATSPDYGPDRALHQILSADFAQRLAAARPHDWVLLGSLSWPGRTTPGTWPSDFQPAASTDIDPAYRTARAAFDLDLCALDLAATDPDAESRTYGPAIAAVIAEIAASDTAVCDETSLGLGGLVRYSVQGSLATDPNVMGVITAQPLDPRYGPRHTVPVDDPITVNIDIKPPRKVTPTVPLQASTRPAIAIPVPGMEPYKPALYPTVNQLADKIIPLVGPPHALRPTPGGPWHRYKDLFDATYLLKTCQIDAEAMRQAINTNWNMTRLQITELPRPYRLYGTGTDHPAIPWAQACDRMRHQQPELHAYPDFPQMAALVAEFADGIATAPAGAHWEPGRGWAAAPSADSGHQAARIAALSFPQPISRMLQTRPSQRDQDSSNRPPSSGPSSEPQLGD